MMKKRLFLTLTLLMVGFTGCNSSTSSPYDDSTSEAEPLFPVASHRPSGVRHISSYALASSSYPDFTVTGGRWNGVYPEGCLGTVYEEAFACGEQLFWQALQFETTKRKEMWAQLQAHNARLLEAGDLESEWLAVLYWRSAQLGVAYLTEQVVSQREETTPEELVEIGLPTQQDVTRAHELDPENVEIESWKVMLEGSSAEYLGQDRAAYVERLYELYESNPPFVLASFLPMAAGMSRNSPWPEIAAQAIEDTEELCKTSDCSVPYTDHVPWLNPGTDFTLAEVMARVGRTERVRFFLERATQRPEFPNWPFRNYVDNALADVDAFVSRFDELADDELAFQVMQINGENACMFCHSPL